MVTVLTVGTVLTVVTLCTVIYNDAEKMLFCSGSLSFSLKTTFFSFIFVRYLIEQRDEGKEAHATDMDSGMDIESILETFNLINACVSCIFFKLKTPFRFAVGRERQMQRSLPPENTCPWGKLVV